MSSDVTICNLALQRLGEARILSLSDDSRAARAMNLLYAPTRDGLLRKHPWNFAIKRAAIAADSTNPAFGYDNAFTIPSDCLRLLSNDKGEGETYMDSWKLEGGKILTNEDGPLYIRYVARVTDPTKLDACFVKLFALRLALDACEELTQSSTKFQLIAEEYKDALKDARRLNAFENPPADSQDGSWISSRI